MGRKPATPPEILDHALNDLPIIKRSRDHKDMYMLKKALYLNEAYKKFLQYIKAQWEDKPTRSWAKSPGSRVYGSDFSACDVSVGCTPYASMHDGGLLMTAGLPGCSTSLQRDNCPVRQGQEEESSLCQGELQDSDFLNVSLLPSPQPYTWMCCYQGCA